MLPLPTIQIHQQPALIGIDADLGKQNLRQPRATFEITTTRPQQEIRQPRGELKIDQSKAWDALARTPILETMNRIYSQAKDVALQGIARIVENGDKLAAIHLNTNPIADIAQQLTFERPEMSFAGPASFDNVDISYTARKAEIQVTDGKVNLNTHPNFPEHNYERGKLDIYMRQFQSVEITPPQIDVKV